MLMLIRLNLLRVSTGPARRANAQFNALDASRVDVPSIELRYRAALQDPKTS